MNRPEPIGAHRARLGECPVWDPQSRRLCWIDIKGEAFLSTDPETGLTDATALGVRPGCIVPRAAGGFACGADQSLFELTSNGLGRTLGTLAGADPGRFNDGKCDPAGRWWVGTAVETGERSCALYRFDADGEPTAVLDGIEMSNGLGWSPDGKTFYYVDTGSQRLRAFDFDAESGALSGERTLRQVVPPRLPDGLTVDAEGAIWLAVWDGACLLRIRPDGGMDRQVDMPVARVTSCTFGGPDYRTLFVTTAADDPGDHANPLAGGLFAMQCDVGGLPAHTFRSGV